MGPKEMHTYDTFTRPDRAMAMRARTILVERFPEAFLPKSAPLRKPLKIGVGQEILMRLPELGARAVALGLMDYTWGERYCRALIEGAPRYGLDGEEAGAVTQAEADHALKRLQWIERQREFDRAERQARRDEVA